MLEVRRLAAFVRRVPASNIHCDLPSLCVSAAVAARGGDEGRVMGVWSSWTLKKPDTAAAAFWCPQGGDGHHHHVDARPLCVCPCVCVCLFLPLCCALEVVAELMGFLAFSFCLRVRACHACDRFSRWSVRWCPLTGEGRL